MIDIKLESPDQLTTAQREAYSSLLQIKNAKKALNGRHPRGMKSQFKLFLLGAYCGEKLQGCALGSIYSGLKGAELHYISIDPALRNQGIAQKLLAYVPQLLKSKGLNYCWFRYLQEDPATQILEHLLAKMGWGAPYNELVRYIFEGVLFDPPWLHEKYTLPQDCQYFLWSELTDAERAHLKHQEEQQTFPRIVVPFSTHYAIEPSNSLGIRKNGEVVGWLITHRINLETVRYSVFYIDRDLRLSQTAGFLLSKSILLQKGTGIPWATCEINFKNVRPAWRRFVENKLKPYSQRIEYEMVVTLHL